MVTITVTGYAAAMIEKANNASFYGINKSFGDTTETVPGRIAAENAAKKWLEDNKIDWNFILIQKAVTIDTSGAKEPYKAKIYFSYC